MEGRGNTGKEEPRRQWPLRRILIAAAGLIMFGVGWVGVFVPGLPTTIFWILAALAFFRSNRRMYERIITNPRFGEAVRLFVEEGRISRRGKVVSICAMLLGAGFAVLVVPLLWVKILVAVAAISGSVWVAVLPTPDIKDCSSTG